MIENTITLGTATDFKKVVQSYGTTLNDSNVGVVAQEKEKSDLSLVGETDFFNFVKGLGLTSNDIAIVSDQQLMEMTQEKRVQSTTVNDNSSVKKLKR